MRRAALLTAIFALAGCQQTLHLYESAHDAGLTATAGQSGQSGKGGSAGITDAGMPDAHCFGGTSQVNYMPDKPRMVVLLDRSTSMSQTFGMYSQLTTALNWLSAQVYDFTSPKRDHPAIQFSFISFPDPDATNCQPQLGCCASSAQTDWQSFSSHVSNCASSSSSGCSNSASHPISAAFATAQAALDSGPPVNNSPRYVVLITDGSPSGGCVTPPSNDCSDAQDKAQSLANEDVKLAVVGVGSSSTLGACLTSLSSGGHFYSAPTDNDLYNDLQDIMSSSVCAVTITSPIPAGSSLQVSVGFTSYPQNSPDGWSYDGSGRLRLYGAMCDSYAQYGGLAISAGCGHTGP